MNTCIASQLGMISVCHRVVYSEICCSLSSFFLCFFSSTRRPNKKFILSLNKENRFYREKKICLMEHTLLRIIDSNMRCCRSASFGFFGGRFLYMKIQSFHDKLFLFFFTLHIYIKMYTYCIIEVH